MSERDLDTLLRDMLDGSLSPEDEAALIDAAASDPDALDDYLTMSEIHATLLYESRATADTEPTDKPEHEAPRVVAIASARSKTLPLAIAAALLAACGLAAYLITTSVDPKTAEPPHQPGPPVATLIENTGDLRTPHGFTSEGESYSAGEYTLASGTAEFMLTNAVNVKLRGQTRMLMHNAMNVSLASGAAEFVVPKDAIGFTVHTPKGNTIVDLGTRFRVDVQPDGSALVKVLDGEVRIDRAAGVSLLLRSKQIASLPSGAPDQIVRSTVIADIARDWVDAAALPEGWAYYDSDAAQGGELRPLKPDQAIGNAGNRGFGGGRFEEYNLSAVLGWDIDDDAQYEIFVDGYEGNAAVPGEDLLVHPGGDPVGHVFLRYTVSEDDVAHGTAATIAGSFRNLVSSGGDTVSVSVLHNGEPRFAINGNTEGTDGEPGMLSQADGSFEFDAALAAGDTVDFVVSNNASIGADETAIRATITLASTPAKPVSNENINDPTSSPPVTAESEQ